MSDYKAIRKSAGMSQIEVAKVVGMTGATVCFFEKGKSVSDETRKKLEDAYSKMESGELKGEKTPRPEKQRAPKLKRKTGSMRKKRAYVRKAVPPIDAPYPTNFVGGADDDGSDEFSVKPPRERVKDEGAGTTNAGIRTTWTPERLHAHIRAFVSDNDIDILERGKSGKRFLMLPIEQVFDLCAVILMACGYNVK